VRYSHSHVRSSSIFLSRVLFSWLIEPRISVCLPASSRSSDAASSRDCQSWVSALLRVSLSRVSARVVSGVHTSPCQIWASITQPAQVSGLGRRRGPRAAARASVIIRFSASAISRSRHANWQAAGVSVLTINEAMRLLADEGLILSKPRADRAVNAPEQVRRSEI
jgi:hypothetical protein